MVMVALIVRLPEDNARFTPDFHQFFVAQVEMDLAERVIQALYPQNFGEGQTAQLEVMRGHCHYGTRRLGEAFGLLDSGISLEVVTDLQGYVDERKLKEVRHRRDTKGVLTTGIYATEAALAEVA